MHYPDPPVMLLDVDGVLNAWGPYPGATTKNRRLNALWGCKMDRGVATCNGRDWTIKWADPLMRRLTALHESGAVEIRWATTWCSDIEGLERLLGLPGWPIAFETAGLHWTKVAQLKRRTAALVQDVEKRRLVWVDDAEVPHHWELAYKAAVMDGRSLLIRPKETLGLLPTDMDQIEQFCGLAAPAAREVTA